ncbi:hypothetical protein P7K49_021496 [Saguinus oedipus]|uniref:Rap-GAP domain-containing protein n=1 Tax=Saguinus oedipus TaxID=9490 RepID=A0ABQ9UUJ8_SAGOE|nr:hypothetical protein P7K49_021496 [Saguinus oedipus]
MEGSRADLRGQPSGCSMGTRLDGAGGRQKAVALAQARHSGIDSGGDSPGEVGGHAAVWKVTRSTADYTHLTGKDTSGSDRAGAQGHTSRQPSPQASIASIPHDLVGWGCRGLRPMPSASHSQLSFQRKVGILYCRAGQGSEEEMYNNQEAGPAFMQFLTLLGSVVRLKGFESYRAQLDTKTDSTGTHSLYTTYQDHEIMFHVSTMLPYTPNNQQQV